MNKALFIVLFIGATTISSAQKIELPNEKYRELKEISKVYPGNVRDIKMYKIIENLYRRTGSLNELHDLKKDLRPYLAQIKNIDHRTQLRHLYTQREGELLASQVGKPAPVFVLQSNLGTTHALTDFKGKVVYLDLWASWCAPCRAGSSTLNVLYNKYKNDDRIAFIGIAVSDNINEWKKAIKDDKLEWLQLLDKDEVVSKAYAASMIPKFVLINKQGNIVSLNALPPSSGAKLEKLLAAEIVK